MNAIVLASRTGVESRRVGIAAVKESATSRKWILGKTVGVPYGSRTRVAAVKEKRPIVIQCNLAAWIALYRTSRTHGNAYWTLNGLSLGFFSAVTGSKSQHERGGVDLRCGDGECSTQWKRNR